MGITLDDFLHNCRVTGSDTIPNNTARLYTYGQIGASGNSVGINFIESKTHNTISCVFNSKLNHQDFYLPSPNYYASDLLLIDSSGYSSSSGPDFFLTKSGGKYKKLRVKLSDYSNYFNSDGTHHTATSSSYGGGISYQKLPGFMVGDTDSDSSIDIYDATYLQMYLSEGADLNDAAKISADVNLDGKIDIDDATYIQKYLSDLL